MSTSKDAKTFLFFGIYLIIAGIAGFASNPEKAKTALLSGGLFGSLSVAVSYLLSKKIPWARKVGIGILVLLSGVFVWRSSAGWIAVSNGQSEKFFAAALITSMLTAACVSLFLVLRKKNN